MNRNRFTTPPPPYNIENKINPLNFQPPIPRFSVWQQPLPPLPPNPSIQPPYILPQPKKNYCSTCDLWTVEPYNNHQASPAHMAKKASLRTNQIYQPIYPNIINNVSNNLSPINTNSTKKKFKRLGKRNNQINTKQLSNDLAEPNESNVIDGFNMVSNELFEKSQLPNTETVRRKGQEMLIPVNGVFCALCEIFFPDKDVAENEHCSSEEHCDAYEKLLKKVQDAKVEKRPFDTGTINDNDSVNTCSKRPKVTQENQDRDFRMLPGDVIPTPEVHIAATTMAEPVMSPMVTGYSISNNISIGGIIAAPITAAPPLPPVPREPAPPVPRDPAPPIPREPAPPVLREPLPPLSRESVTPVSSVAPVTSTPINSTVTFSSTVLATPTVAVTSSASSNTNSGTANSNISGNEIDRSSASDYQAPDFSLEFPDDMEDYDEGEIISEPES